MTAPRTLRLKDLVIGYGRQPIAGPLSAEWQGGGVHVLLGRNGSGKTTLTRTLLRLLPPISGSIVEDESAPRSWVPQRAVWFEGAPLRVFDVVEMGLWGRMKDGTPRLGRSPGGLSRRERALRVRELLTEVGLEGFEKRAFARLSGGQKQRALLARALITEAKLLVFDEPTAGIDEPTRLALGALLTKTADDASRLVLVITHDRSWLRSTPKSTVHLRRDQLVVEEGAC